MPLVALGFNFSWKSTKLFKRKSDLFEAVETALDLYVKTSSDADLLALTAALGAWKLSKKRFIPDDSNQYKNWTDTSRAKAVELLSNWLIRESTARGIFPDPGPVWTNNHNCYAFAMKCSNPHGAGLHSRPGKYADRPASRRDGFVQGVVDDGLASGGSVVNVLRQGGLPTPVPGRLAGSYLVALVASTYGYHFLRRDEVTGLWMHKNGAPSPVENCFYDNTTEQPVAITDAVVANLLLNPARMGCTMTFEAYFSVPTAGIQVAG
jgi:hypothetical protein